MKSYLDTVWSAFRPFDGYSLFISSFSVIVKFNIYNIQYTKPNHKTVSWYCVCVRISIGLMLLILVLKSKTMGYLGEPLEMEPILCYFCRFQQIVYFFVLHPLSSSAIERITWCVTLGSSTEWKTIAHLTFRNCGSIFSLSVCIFSRLHHQSSPLAPQCVGWCMSIFLHSQIDFISSCQ